MSIKGESPEEAPAAQAVLHVLHEYEKRLLIALEDYFWCAERLAEARIEAVTRSYRNLAAYRARLSSAEARLKEFRQVRNGIWQEALDTFVERDGPRVRHLRNRSEDLERDEEATREEIRDLRSEIRGLNGAPRTARELAETEKQIRAGVRREVELAWKGIRRVYEGRRLKLAKTTTKEKEGIDA